ncbi:MAG TPA: MarR family transcriptional regulator [Terracidiphilus sp.]|nr:MarR family transcriptional regulator [Terracidiphilus sp.]
MAPLKHEIAQQRPFSSREEEAMLNILRTADCLEHDFQRATRTWGVTVTQYNVLRILRGAHPRGLTCKAIGDRMITAVPDITRLLARLKAQKLIRQERDPEDRRMVWTRISVKGLELLQAMDPIVQKAPREMLEHLGEDGLDRLIRLLELARGRCGRTQQELSCDGNEEPA